MRAIGAKNGEAKGNDFGCKEQCKRDRVYMPREDLPDIRAEGKRSKQEHEEEKRSEWQKDKGCTRPGLRTLLSEFDAQPDGAAGCDERAAQDKQCKCAHRTASIGPSALPEMNCST